MSRVSNLPLEEREKALIEDVKNKYGNMYTLVKGTFTKREEPAKFICNGCGNEFTIRPKTLLQVKNRVGCINCYGNKRNIKKHNEEDFKKALYDKYKDEFQLVDKFIDRYTPVNFFHKKCGNYFLSTPKNMICCTHTRYSKCANNTAFTIDDVKEQVKQMYGNEYEVLSKDYKNNKCKLLFRHNKCGKTFEMKWNSFSSNKNTCPHCVGHLRFDKNKFIDIFNKTNTHYEIVSEYKALSRPIKIKHKNCGYVYIVKEAR